MGSGWSDVRRRTFLTTTTVSLVGLLADRLPKGRLRVDGEPLDQLATAITELRYLDGRDGSATVLMPASWLAGRLTTALANTPPAGDDHRAVADLAADAAELAGWAAFETGEYGAALAWYDRAIAAASSAANPGLVAFAGEARAQVLWLGLHKTEAALQQLDQIDLRPITSNLRARVHVCRARVLAARRDEPATHRAIEAARTAASQPSADDGSPWSGWSASPANIDLRQGLALIDLGYAGSADALLTASLRSVPAKLRRAAGTIHTGLARAAILLADPEGAAKHAALAHTIFITTRSRQLLDVNAVVRELRDRWGDVRAVRDLDEQRRAEAEGAIAYWLCRTEERGTRVHQASCRYVRRGRARPWPATGRLDPAEAAKLALRSGYELCQRCMPT